MSSPRGLDRREAALQRLDRRRGVVDRQGGLGQEGEVVGIGRGEGLDIGDRLDQRHRALRHLAEGADDFRVPGMADEDDVAAHLDQPLGLAMHLGDERAGGVEIFEAPAFGIGGYRLGHAVRGEHDMRILGHLVQFLDEDRPLAFRLSTTNLLWTISCRT